MNREICFCGRVGAIEEREPIYLGDGDWGLACPRCGHINRLDGWPEAAREWALTEAARRREAANMPDLLHRPRPAA